MAVRAVLDVNVIVSGILGLALHRSSPPVTSLVAGLEGDFVLVASPALLDELHAVLRRPRLGLGPDLAARWADLVGSSAEIVRSRGRLEVLKRDPADNEALECALSGRARFVVSGKARHFEELRRGRGKGKGLSYRGVAILNPRAFVDSVLRR